MIKTSEFDVVLAKYRSKFNSSPPIINMLPKKSLYLMKEAIKTNIPFTHKDLGLPDKANT